MIRRFFRPLDRYVFSEFAKIFLSTALGFPLLVTIFDLTDNLDKYLNRNLPRMDIARSYLYWIPDNMSMVLPAATLFAAVFTIGQLCVSVGPHMIDSVIHHRGGPIFFALSLIPFFILVYFLVKSDRSKAKPKKPAA